jgi:hypothetical protein
MRIDLIDDASNLTYVAAYLVKDILWLRILSIAGSLIVLPYFLLQPEPLWTPVFWSFVFISINLTRAWQIFLDRRPVKLTAEEEALYNQGFSSLSSRQFGKLTAVGTWLDLEVDQRLQSDDKLSPMITLIADGKLELSRKGKLLDSLGAGDFHGISSLYEESHALLPELLDARISAAARVLQWNAGELKQLTQSDPELDHALGKLIASSLASKVDVYLRKM